MEHQIKFLSGEENMSWEVAREYARSKYSINTAYNTPDKAKANKAFKDGCVYNRPSLSIKDPRVVFEASSFTYNHYNDVTGTLETKLAYAFYSGMKWAEGLV